MDGEAPGGAAVSGHELAVGTVAVELPRPIIALDDATLAEARDLALGLGSFGALDDEGAERADQILGQAKGFLRELEKRREDVKRPVLDLGRAIDGVVRAVAEPIKEASDDLGRRLLAFTRERAAQARERAEAAALAEIDAKAQPLLEEYRKLRTETPPNEAELRALRTRIVFVGSEAQALGVQTPAVAQRKLRITDALRMAAVEIGSQLERLRRARELEAAANGTTSAPPPPLRAPEPVAVVVPVRPVHVPEPARPASVTARKVQRLRILDATLVPVEIGGAMIRPVDERAVLALMKAGVKVPGCEIVEEESVVTRSSKA